MFSEGLFCYQTTNVHLFRNLLVNVNHITVQHRCNFTLAREIYSNSYRATRTWQVFYYPRGTHARLLDDDLRELFLTWLRTLTIIDHHNLLR